MARTDHKEHRESGVTSLVTAALDRIAVIARRDGRLEDHLIMKSGAERQKALTASKLAAGLKLSNVWLPAETLSHLKTKFPGPRGGIDWDGVAKAAIAGGSKGVEVKTATESAVQDRQLVTEPTVVPEQKRHTPSAPKKPETLDPYQIPLFKNHPGRRIKPDETGDDWRREALARLGIDFDRYWVRLKKNEHRRILLARGRKNVPWELSLSMIMQAFEMGQKRPEKPENMR